MENVTPIFYYEPPINTDFRVSIIFEGNVLSMQSDINELIIKTLETYYPIIPSNIPEAVSMALWFYQCGKENKGGKKKSSSQIKVISFEHDAEYIYAAFLDQYGIDLQETKMHWWKFSALFHSLKDDNKIVKIMGYRAISLNNKMSKEQKEFYLEMKKLYAIPMSDEQQKMIDSVQDMLITGTFSKVL
jgi:hypothetical protein